MLAAWTAISRMWTTSSRLALVGSLFQVDSTLSAAWQILPTSSKPTAWDAPLRLWNCR